MELKQLQYFRIIAQCNSISGAAEKLYIMQPALSRSMKRLEEEVGTPLFLRKNNGVELTRAGAAFLVEVEQMFAHFERGLDHARMLAAQQRPTLSIACAFEEMANGLMEQLHSLFPDVQTMEDTLPPSQAIRELFAGHVDFALVPRIVEHAGIVYERLLCEEMLLSAPAEHPLCGKPSVSPQELDGQSCVCNEVCYDWDSILQACTEHHVSMQLAFSSNIHQKTGKFKTLTNSVLFVPIGSIADTPADDTRKLIFPTRIVPQIFFRTIYLAYYENRVFSPAEKYYVDALRGYFRKRSKQIREFTLRTFGQVAVQ